jgi:hypothetical protein
MSIKSRAYIIARDQLANLKYCYWDAVVGLIGTVCGNYDVPLTQENIDAIKEAIQDKFSPGVEFEWDSYGMWQWWENLSVEWFSLIPTPPSFGKEYAPNIKCSKSPADFKESDAEPLTSG